MQPGGGKFRRPLFVSSGQGSVALHASQSSFWLNEEFVVTNL
jgi:hypothetical protein